MSGTSTQIVIKPEKKGRSCDYRETLLLPKTDFPMKAQLTKLEPKLLEFWKKQNLYKRLREDAQDREPFILHDGPPYANGHLHMGHALNKILKDIVVKSQQMMGKDANYVPGWDCHGLPIGWKIEEKYRKAGKSKDDVPILEFRKECREFAEHWIDIQSTEFQRLGVIGDWAHPYTTMSFDAEAQIVREFLKFVMNGGLYRGSKPVMWSVVERTALAEAEIEYRDHVSPFIYVRFPVVDGPAALKSASVVIWTTTPWTIPGNRAVAYSETISYGLYEVISVLEESHSRIGECLILADSLAEHVKAEARIEKWTRLGDSKGIGNLVLAHPFRGQGYDFDVPVLAGDFVTQDTGTGFVHIAPGHGIDDFGLAVKHQLEVPFTVDENGVYYDHVPLFGGKRILHTEGTKLGTYDEANGAVIGELVGAGKLLTNRRYDHSYPHSWRSKVPLIFRHTTQWFISMDANDLRRKALAEIDNVRWVPPQGRNRIHSMIQTRPDWVVSRQRSWGVPLTLFVDIDSGEVLQDEAVNKRIVDAIEQEGADAWFASDASRFLGNDYNEEDYEKVEDILDVWFDSGSTHSFVLEQRDDLKWPASLYLEGSDQHRGWFHSSLLVSCGTHGRAPYEAVLTHGFLLDEKGHKMSKSLGNAVEPQKVTEQNGAEILRLWAASSDYTQDLRIGPEIIKANVDSYRKIRNTLRYLLGNLHGFDPGQAVPVHQMPELERYILHCLVELDNVVREAYDSFDFRRVFTHLFNFCTLELSALYFDVRKDNLYCDAKSDPVRQSCQTVLDHLFTCLTTWFAPILCFTTEESWLERFSNREASVHLAQFPDVSGSWRDVALGEKWQLVRRLRRVVTGALEVERRDKRIGSSLEASPQIFVQDRSYKRAFDGLDLAEIFITSQASVEEGSPPVGAFTLEDVDGVAVITGLARGTKCERCWKVLPDVDSVPEYPAICSRCAQVVGQLDAEK